MKHLSSTNATPHFRKESVRIKPREKAKLNWDDKLTLEFNGDAPVCQSISIEPADPSVITVFLCGNSTVVDQDNEPWASWGQMIPHFSVRTFVSPIMRNRANQPIRLLPQDV